MKSFILGLSFIILPFACCSGIDIKNFYRIFASGIKDEVNTCIVELKSEKPSSQIYAFTGAMLMKQAGMEKEPIEKLESFKAGHKLLEAEITEHPNNTEYHFLRIAIQESAPKFLGYDKNLQEDKNLIIQGFKKLDATLQEYILQYCKQSKILKAEELQ